MKEELFSVQHHSNCHTFTARDMNCHAYYTYHRKWTSLMVIVSSNERPNLIITCFHGICWPATLAPTPSHTNTLHPTPSYQHPPPHPLTPVNSLGHNKNLRPGLPVQYSITDDLFQIIYIYRESITHTHTPIQHNTINDIHSKSICMCFYHEN